MKQQVDETTSWWKRKLVKMKVNQNCKLTKTIILQKPKLAEQHVDKTVSWKTVR